MKLSRTDLGRVGPLRSALRDRPLWADRTLARRVAAALLALLALALFVRGDPGARRTDVVVAARDLAPGAVLTTGDLRMAPRIAGDLPDHVILDRREVLGATLTGAMRAGETFTDLRVVGARLAEVAGGGVGARIVPLRLADSAVADILRAGDRVDVIGGEESGSGGRPARTLAADVAVVLVSAAGDRRTAGAERVVLVAMDGERATAVAAASLHTALTVVFH